MFDTKKFVHSIFDTRFCSTNQFLIKCRHVEYMITRGRRGLKSSKIRQFLSNPQLSKYLFHTNDKLMYFDVLNVAFK